MEYVAVLLPSISIGIIFWLVLRWMFRSDRTERTAQARSEADAERWYEELKRRDGTDVPFGGRSRPSRRERRPRP